jgi:hypothetical protein
MAGIGKHAIKGISVDRSVLASELFRLSTTTPRYCSCLLTKHLRLSRKTGKYSVLAEHPRSRLHRIPAIKPRHVTHLVPALKCPGQKRGFSRVAYVSLTPVIHHHLLALIYDLGLMDMCGY